MPDNLEQSGPRDGSRVNVNEPWELRYWSQRFGVSPDELKQIVKRVGVMVADVAHAVAARTKR